MVSEPRFSEDQLETARRVLTVLAKDVETDQGRVVLFKKGLHFV